MVKLIMWLFIGVLLLDAGVQMYEIYLYSQDYEWDSRCSGHYSA